jgi:hypothetical protein
MTDRSAPPQLRAVAAALACAVLVGAFAAGMPQAALGARPRVVIVVGPSGASTDRYLARADVIARQAASYGATVVKVYTPRATWDRVRTAAQGARLLVYLGHGNGYPSPYGAFQPWTKDGFGLNPTLNSGLRSPVRYVGEAYIGAQIRLARGSVVLLNHLCYASGAAEPGMSNPSWSVARQRVDNYAAGFMNAGASAVIADAHTDLSHEVRWVLGPGSRNLARTWRSDWEGHGHVRSFASSRTRGLTNYLDPDRPGSGFYRALTTRSTFLTGSGAPLPSPTPGPSPTATPRPSPTPTPQPTATPRPTASASPFPTPRPTVTPRPSATPRPTPAPKPTPTPRPTATAQPTPSPTPAPSGPLAGVACDVARIRVAPRKSADTAGSVGRGTPLALIGPFVADAKGRTWAPVEAPHGVAGFVQASEIAWAGEAVADKDVEVRGWSDAWAETLAVVDAGDPFVVTGSSGEWWRLWLRVRLADGTEGWVDAVGVRAAR